MENATKALLIAAAVLIAILLISLGIIVMRQGTTAVQDAGSGLDTAAAEQFNAKFTGYEGSHKSTAQVNALCREVLSHNLAETEAGTNRWVTVTDGGTTTYQSSGAASAHRFTGNNYYTVTCIYSGTIITSITVN